MAIKFETLASFVQAGFSGLWVVGHEPEQAQQSICNLLEKSDVDFTACSWDCARGLVELLDTAKGPAGPEERRRQLSPDYPLSRDVAAHNKVTEVDGESKVEDRRIIFLHNFHRFLESPVVVQALYNALVEGESIGTHYVILTPSMRIPPELEKAFTTFEFPLPNPAEITSTATELLAAAGLPTQADTAVVDAARGLTRRELRNVLALSIYSKESLDPKVIWDEKAEAVKKSGVLQLLNTNDTFASIAGLEGAKSLVKGLCTFNSRIGEHAKGILLTGCPGTGKSHFCRAMGAETNRPVLRLDVGSLMDKHVGESESRLRLALAVAEAIAPCILQIEEIEKALAGSSGDGDSGVMRRMFGHLLTWMEERTAPVFVTATSNDTSKLPPELLRAGRWSCEMFVDLPTRQEKDAIWAMYAGKYGLMVSRDVVNDEGWTGGEIRQACYLSAQLNVPLTEAAKRVRVTYHARRDLINTMRKNAEESMMLSATTGEPYRIPTTSTTVEVKPARKVSTKTNKDVV